MKRGRRRKVLNSIMSKKKKERQTSFKKDVQALVYVIDDIGNPFLEESGDVLIIDSKT